MSTVVVIVISVCSFALGILGTVASSERELMPDTDGVPYWNNEKFERGAKREKRLLMASAALALVGTVLSLIWK